MKKIIPLFAVLLLMVLPLKGWGQVADSIDVIDYNISLDLSHGSPYHGEALLTVRLLRECDSMSLALLGQADSIWLNGQRKESVALSAIPVTGIGVGDTFTLRICYHGTGYVENQGFGGFHFDNNIHYNLGVAFNTDPHVIGRAFMPCRDNFHDKATYTLRIHAKQGWTAECSGILEERSSLDDGAEQSVWRIGQPVPTYLVGISQAKWKRMDTTVAGYPATYGFLTQPRYTVRRVFEKLDSVVPMYERCFGPYRWGRIGYISTPYGSMEHVNNIALAHQAMESVTEMGQTNIWHELGHAWFGNLVTCTTEEDMWINEGGASFCSEVAMEAASGHDAAIRYYQKNLENVIRSTHITDDGYRPLSPMPHTYTYGSTSYDKGWMVWHSLRGYLGDSLLYASVRRLMDSKAFGNADAYEVRDSLSLYSGVDLADFFNFHVFSPGFVDYHLAVEYPEESGRRIARVAIHQQSIGTDAVVRGNRLPVTFYSHSGEQYKQWIAFDGSDTVVEVTLPFSDPAYHLLDADCEISDAAVIGGFDATETGLHAMDVAHLRLSSEQSQGTGSRIVVEHHWGKPMGADSTEGVVRVANRYWQVRGSENYFYDVTGHFRFVCEEANEPSYAHLDRGFYEHLRSADSLALLYRRDAQSPWIVLTRSRSGDADGFLVAQHIQPGEYTLAVIDSTRAGIAHPTAQNVVLFPNPVRQGESISLHLATTEAVSLHFIDASGREAWRQEGYRSGLKIKPPLTAGTYLVIIENKIVSLQSKIIVL